MSDWLTESKTGPTKGAEQKGTLNDALKQFQVGRQVHLVLCSLVENHPTRPRSAAQDPLSQFQSKGRDIEVSYFVAWSIRTSKF